jgi:DNA-binding Lrp family transcriptional regulator
MRSPVASIDAVDFAIYRYLSPDGAARFWASRRQIDPRITAQQLAPHVGISEAGVRTRLRSLRERGFLRTSDVCLNPSLFGVTMNVVEIPVDEAGEARRLLSELALVDGVTFSRDTLDEEDRKLQVYFVADSSAATNRRMALIRRLAERREARGPNSYFIPSAERALSPLEWRIVGGFRKQPDAPLGEVARELKISLKTLSRRFHALLDGRAIWWTHGRSTAEMPLALLTATVRPPTRADVLASRLASELPNWMPVARDGMGLLPEDPDTRFAGLQLIESPAAVESTVQRILDLPGVASVRRTFALGSATYPAWFDERIERRVSGRTATVEI